MRATRVLVNQEEMEAAMEAAINATQGRMEATMKVG
jgi:hypothetical protein